MNYSPKDVAGKPPHLMSTTELVENTGFKLDTVQKWARAGKFGAEKLQSRWRFKRHLILEALGPEAAGYAPREAAVTP